MPFYLGLDSSTQSVKAVVIDTASGTVRAEANVNFGRDLPSYNSPNGFLPGPDPLVKHSDPLMWVEALELVLSRLAAAGAPMAAIAGVCGSGQQHGSVYLRKGFESALASLDPSKGLAAQVKPLLARATSPIWMDSSTGAECREIESAIGRSRLIATTGSPAIERFTGPQIRRFFKSEPDAYAATARIHLVSSFLASLLIGGDAPVDTGDGAGMNLLDLAAGAWSQEIAEATAPGLAAKLPRVAGPGSIAGGLSPFFKKFGLTPGVPVAVWSGDNPCSLVGVGAWQPGTAVISLGTSYTFFAAMPAPKTDPDGFGHVFGNPAGGFMSLICFKNGALTRERIKKEHGLSWEQVEELIASGPPGAGGALILPWFVPEITPVVLREGERRRGPPEFTSPDCPAGLLLRAVTECQALSLRIHSAWIGRFDRIRVTGGASASPALRQVLADVFQAPVETIAVSDSAALGAAAMAAQASGGAPWGALADLFARPVETVQPNPGRAGLYADMAARYAAFEREEAANG